MSPNSFFNNNLFNDNVPSDSEDSGADFSADNLNSVMEIHAPVVATPCDSYDHDSISGYNKSTTATSRIGDGQEISCQEIPGFGRLAVIGQCMETISTSILMTREEAYAACEQGSSVHTGTSATVSANIKIVMELRRPDGETTRFEMPASVDVPGHVKVCVSVE